MVECSVVNKMSLILKYELYVLSELSKRGMSCEDVEMFHYEVWLKSVELNSVELKAEKLLLKERLRLENVLLKDGLRLEKELLKESVRLEKDRLRLEKKALKESSLLLSKSEKKVERRGRPRKEKSVKSNRFFENRFKILDSLNDKTVQGLLLLRSKVALKKN